VEDVPEGALGRHRGGRLFQRRGSHPQRSRALPGAVRDRSQDATRPYRRNHEPGERRVGGADRPQPHGRPRRSSPRL
jgi:hypothetical protein